MKREIITIQQSIEITYESEKARSLAIAEVKKDTNWMRIIRTLTGPLDERFSCSKVNDVKIL